MCASMISQVRGRVTAVASCALLLTSLGVVGAPAASASPSDVPAPTAKVDCVQLDPATGACDVPGVVYAMTQVGGTTYIGGSFTSVSGVPRANVAAIRPDGTLDPTWNPSTNGIVYALAAASDGSKIYLGGAFTAVDGQSRRLAAVTPDTGDLVSSWTANTNNNLVRAIVADGGDRLYVGGSFGRIGGRAIPKLGAVSQSTGAVDTSFAPRPSATIRALTLSDDATKLYAGGGYSTIGGQARPGAAELDAATGAVTSFAPTDGGVVISMDMSPSGRLFFGTTSNRTWAYDPAVSNTGLYRVRTGGDVQAILATDDEVYIGGHFNTLPEAHLDRVALASFLPADGATTTWNPGANGSFGVWTIALTATSNGASALSIGGDFTRVAGLARRGYARFDFS
jgi:hypothetical protein